jgi:hypothetical protein
MAEQVRTQRKLPFAIDVSDDVAARIAAETDSLRVAKEMLTVLLAEELEGMTGTPDRVVLTRWDPKVAGRFLRKGNRRRMIGFAGAIDTGGGVEEVLLQASARMLVYAVREDCGRV